MDIIGLQEVREGSLGSQLEQLSRLLPEYKYIGFEVATHQTSDNMREGVAIMSKYPILQRRWGDFS